MNCPTPGKLGITSDTDNPRAMQQGFTLVETSIAMVVMMVLGLAAAGLFVYAVKYNAGANDRALAVSIAQQRMERLRKTSFTDASMAAGTVTESYNGGGRLYNVVTTICSTSDCGGSATSKLITVQVAPAVSGNAWSRSAITIITKRTSASVGSYLP